MVVTVPEEGTYGFSAVVQNGAGVSGPPPKSGQQPEIWIVVDMTKPLVRIASAMQGSGPEARSLIISWEASDQRLTAAPISLSYGLSPTGPWNPIASGLENTGHYAWAIDSGTPPQLYLRLEARDEAGNVGTFITPQPVVLDISAPKGARSRRASARPIRPAFCRAELFAVGANLGRRVPSGYNAHRGGGFSPN